MPTEYAVREPDLGQTEPKLADVRFATGYIDGEIRDYKPASFSRDEISYQRAPQITRAGWIDISPQVDDLEVRVWLRNNSLPNRDFLPVKAFTGEIKGALPNELNFIDGALRGPTRLPVANFGKVYNGFDIWDGDLILVELTQRSTGRVQRLVFTYRSFGLRTRFSYAVLFRVPIPGVQEASTIDVGGLNLTVSLSLGYSFRTTSNIGKWVSDRVAGVLVAGVGSTYQIDTTLPVDDQVRGAFSSGVFGAGVEVLNFLSVNVLLNPSALIERQSQSTWALAVGFDAVRFAGFTSEIYGRLFGRNRLEPMTPDAPTPPPISGP